MKTFLSSLIKNSDMELKKTFQTSKFSIMILFYIDTEIDYQPFLLFNRVVSQDYTYQDIKPI